jgi:excisionase family DNA binding protein
MTEELLTTQEVAILLRVHPKHVYRLLKRGLPARRLGAEWRFSRDEVLAWSGARPATAPAASALPLPAGPPPSLIAANGDVAVTVLLRLAHALGPPILGLVQADMGTAAELLRRREVLAAGARAGGFPGHPGEPRLARVHLVQREIGLAYRRGSAPLQLRDLPDKRLASRPVSAGLRQALDEALRGEGLDPDQVHRRALLLSSHLEVVLAVAAGSADVGLCSRAWGERAGLGFLALSTEAYGLVVAASDLGDARVERLREVARSPAFREEVGAVAGYDVSGAGDLRHDV